MSDELEVQEETPEPETVETEPEAEELIVTLGEEAPEDAEADEAELEDGAEPDTKVIRMLRRKADDAAKVKAELRDTKRKLAELEANSITAPAKIELGAKPTLGDADYDTAKFELMLDDWKEKERNAKAQYAATRAAQEAAARDWQGKIDGYTAAKKSLRVQAFDEAEADAREILSPTQQAIILQGSENPALMVYALGRNPEEAKKLAAIKDPVQFAFAVAKMEATKLKATPRKPTAAPEQVVKGSGQPPSVATAKLDQLLAKARISGDYTAVRAAKKAAAS